MTEEKQLIEFSRLTLNNIIIQARDVDNYINATQLCKAGGKKFNHWYALDSTKDLIKELEKNLSTNGHKCLKLVDKKVGGNHSGSWIHPRLATHIAMWISPKFSIKISEWIEEWKLFSDENKSRFEFEISNLQPSTNTLKEKQYNDKYKAILDAKSEVQTPVGYIDLLTETDLIKIKIGSNWKHGIGQLICYGTFYCNHQKWLYLFDHESISQSEKLILIDICSTNQINVKFID